MMRRSYSGAATSGVALSLLNDQDNTRLAVTSESIRDAAKEMAKKMWLKAVQGSIRAAAAGMAGGNSSVGWPALMPACLQATMLFTRRKNGLPQRRDAAQGRCCFDLMARGCSAPWGGGAKGEAAAPLRRWGWAIGGT